MRRVRELQRSAPELMASAAPTEHPLVPRCVALATPYSVVALLVAAVRAPPKGCPPW